ncbi:hypothetical protein VNI00_014322 [Paramarasmius palmivorus]|uniref:Cytochrome P450 n=1 Tax=Paramarasmius palmivorus TaxID=297713 RepID=A0AAW0BSS5_9AGAR
MFEVPGILYALAGCGFVMVLVQVLYNRTKPNPAPLPPGPKGLPILGNALDFPQSQPWVTFAQWAKEYGPIVHLQVLGQSIVILNDVNYAFDMLDKKGRQYSNRPTLVMGGELVGWDQGPALIQFGKTWSDYRRLMAQFLGTRSRVDTSYGEILRGATREFLRDIKENPNEWREHGRRFAAAIVLKITYGYKAGDKDDALVKLVDEAMEQFSETTTPNAFAVDLFPFLKFVPEWVPGTAWKKKATHYHATLQAMLNRPYDMVKEQMSRGTATSCFVSDLLDTKKSEDENEQSIKWAAAGIYSAAVTETFFLAMTLHQDEQRKAQDELDRVLGRSVMPTAADRARLPYTEALFLEVFRKYSIGPLGLPHVAVTDDIHQGYHIPKNSMILTNNWLFYRDSRLYADPEKFSPERFLSSNGRNKELDPRDILFGYGRRACPGVHLADASMWILFSSILAFFHINPPVRNGNPILPSGKFTEGTISRPEPFDCVITPRDETTDIIYRNLDED